MEAPLMAEVSHYTDENGMETTTRSSPIVYEEIGKITESQQEEQSQGSKDSFHWNPSSINLMLLERFKRHKEFLEPTQPKVNMWKEIAEILNHNGYQVTGQLCNLKFRNLMQTFRSNRQKEINGQEWQINWEYYDMFKENLEQKQTSLNSLQLESALAEHHDSGTPCISAFLDDDDKYDAYGSPRIADNHIPKQVQSSFGKHCQSPTSMPISEIQRTPKSDGSCSPSSNILTPEVSLEIGHEMSIKETTSNTDFLSEKQRQRIAILNECRIFGESIGYQLSMVKDLRDRALTQFKIQELIYKAKIGILKE